MDVINVLKDKWWLFALIFILAFAYYIRSFNIVPDRLLSFDPIFQYRYTKYFADWGHMPVWDELTYYVGRLIDSTLTQPLMYYITSIFFWIFNPLLGISLFTVSSYMSAIYGALIVIPSFLLGRELSNKYGGIMAAFLMGTAPQILIRTFGSSYDTDQIVLFFLVLTLYVGFYALKKRSIPGFCLALAGFSAFMLAWNNFWYTFIILAATVIFYFFVNIILKIREKESFSQKLKFSFGKIKLQILILLALFLGIVAIGILNSTDVFVNLFTLIGFAQNAEQWIVNISIAELQPFNIFNIEGWILAMGRFYTGDLFIDSFILVLFFLFMAFGIFRNFKKKDALNLSFIIVLLLVAVYTSFRGVRFTEFTSTMFIILVSVGFGSLVEWTGNKKLYKTVAIGVGIFLIIIAMNLGMQLGQGLGPDVNANWDNAWTFLKTQTPEFSLVGTWWDPGHMITGLAERRVIADGAHCQLGTNGNACLYTINDRITDLGKIMVTSDENESLELIRKYQGDSPEVYWIASDDLIGKFRWLQYFGTGCDGTEDPSCPLYIQLSQSSQSTDNSGNVVFVNYDMGQDSKLVIYNGPIPIPLFVQGINIALFDEFIFYNGTQSIPIKFTQEELNTVITSLKPLESQLGARFTNQTIPMTVWMPIHYQYVVIIPPTLRESVFTKMFMLEGEGLDHFKQVFRNEQVKIYQVV